MFTKQKTKNMAAFCGPCSIGCEKDLSAVTHTYICAKKRRGNDNNNKEN